MVDSKLIQDFKVVARDLKLIQVFQQVALNFHREQTRKKTENGFELPYFYHPMTVGQLVWKWGAGSPINLMAATAHDVLEDCNVDAVGFEKEVVATANNMIGISVDRIEQIKKAIEIVKELTFIEDEIHTKSAYLESFYLKSIDSLIIKLADRYSNVMDFYDGGDAKYALKYFNKAQVLFDISDARKEEICSVYPNTYSRIKSHHFKVLDTITNK